MRSPKDPIYDYHRFTHSLAHKIASCLDIDEQEVIIENAKHNKITADFAIPCFRFSKIKKLSPQQIASQLAGELLIPEALSIEAFSGYLNVQLKPEYMVEAIRNDLSLHSSYGFLSQSQPKSIVVDFVGLNLAKPFSVGHLRPTVQGWALVNLYRALGYSVVGDNHLGDWGIPFGMWAAAYKRWGDESKLAQDGVYELGRLYVRFRKESKDNPELIDQAHAWLKKLESSEPEATQLKDRFSELSIAHMNRVLKRLEIYPDQTIGESFYIPKVPLYLADLMLKGVALEQEDGTIIAPLDDCGIDTPILLRKSNGSFLYASTDIVAIDYRVHRWHPEKIVYSVGQEQQFHFKQLFALSHKIGYEVELEHAWFGLIEEIDEDGARRKMSSRSGISYLEQLLDLAESKAKAMLPEDSIVSDRDISLIANAAIKFADFSQSRKQNILFDWNTMFSLSGYSGPYIQYAAVRINSIIKKAGEVRKNIPIGDYNWQDERKLLWLTYKYNEVLKTAASQNEPFIIAAYSYELAKTFNRYYESHLVLRASNEIREKRLWTLALVRNVLTSGLGILGISIPESM